MGIHRNQEAIYLPHRYNHIFILLMKSQVPGFHQWHHNVCRPCDVSLWFVVFIAPRFSQLLLAVSRMFMFFRHFQGTKIARELLMQGNLSQFDLLLEEIKDPRNHPRNYFMEACKWSHWFHPDVLTDPSITTSWDKHLVRSYQTLSTGDPQN